MKGLIKAVCFPLLLIFCASCFEINCEKLVSIHKPKVCNIIVEELPERSRRFTIKGINPETQRRVTYTDEESWYVYFSEKIEVGDTVVKRNGELTFFIHKADTVLAFPYRCKGNVYE